jgi:hypothetical protein
MQILKVLLLIVGIILVYPIPLYLQVTTQSPALWILFYIPLLEGTGILIGKLFPQNPQTALPK